MDIGRGVRPPAAASVARRITLSVAALALMAASPLPAAADGLFKDETAKAMVLLLSLSQALAQKGTPAPVKQEAKPVPVAAAETAPGNAVAASDSTPANAATEGASTPPADR
jgi:hypothetical protein